MLARAAAASSLVAGLRSRSVQQAYAAGHVAGLRSISLVRSAAALPSPRLAVAAVAATTASVLTTVFIPCDCASSVEPSQVFISKGDPYKGVSVSLEHVNECLTVEYFREKLTNSLGEWRANGRKGVWIQIPSGRPEFIAAAQALGFTYHHAEPEYLMMCTWLGDGDSMLPANASHSIGVGIVCINAHDELVMVQEATGPASGRPGGFWKVPTGLGVRLCPTPSVRAAPAPDCRIKLPA